MLKSIETLTIIELNQFTLAQILITGDVRVLGKDHDLGEAKGFRIEN